MALVNVHTSITKKKKQVKYSKNIGDMKNSVRPQVGCISTCITQ